MAHLTWLRPNVKDKLHANFLYVFDILPLLKKEIRAGATLLNNVSFIWISTAMSTNVAENLTHYDGKMALFTMFL